VPGEHVAATEHELARGEVAVLGQHVVQVDLGAAVTRVVREHHPDGAFAVLDQERVPAVHRGGVEVRVVPADVALVRHQHVFEVCVGPGDLEHGVLALVVAVPHQPPQVDAVDHREHRVHADHRPDRDRGVEADQDHTADQVQHPQSQDPGLEQ
jgi:hypothetical protein